MVSCKRIPCKKCTGRIWQFADFDSDIPVCSGEGRRQLLFDDIRRFCPEFSVYAGYKAFLHKDVEEIMYPCHCLRGHLYHSGSFSYACFFRFRNSRCFYAEIHKRSIRSASVVYVCADRTLPYGTGCTAYQGAYWI